jgi:hypothetical protein
VNFSGPPDSDYEGLPGRPRVLDDRAAALTGAGLVAPRASTLTLTDAHPPSAAG